MRILLMSLAGLGLALLAWPGTALADGEVSFGLRPTKGVEGRPETFSYFSHELAPGAVLTDEALVMNSGEVPVTLKLYAADAMTAINCGTAFAQQGQETNGVARWLSLSLGEVSLEPGEEMVVPFTINVPADASPGHHVAGLVLEAPPSGEAAPSGEGEAQFAANVIRQAAVAVVIDVPGPHVAGLEITGISMKEQDENQGATFVIAVHNTGNIFVKGEGSLVIKDWQGTELASVPLKMDTVLPGDATHFQVTHPVHLADGKYLLSAVLEYDGKTAVLEGAEVEVKDGQPVVPEEGEPQPGLAPPITTLTPAEEEGGAPIGRYVAFGAALLALVVAGVAVIRWRRTRARRSSP